MRLLYWGRWGVFVGKVWMYAEMGRRRRRWWCGVVVVYISKLQSVLEVWEEVGGGTGIV
jgi:hypothetical protein